MINFFILMGLSPLLAFNAVFRKKYYSFYCPMGSVGNVGELHTYFSSKTESTFFIEREKLSNLKYWILCLMKLSESKVLFLSHGIGGLPLSWVLTNRVQLWHGLPIKKVLLENESDCNPSNRLFYFIYKLRLMMSYNYLVTGTGLAADNLVKSFGYPESKVIRFGNPIHRIITKQGNQRLLYIVPTWRETSETTTDYIKNILDDRLFNFVKENDILVKIMPHPFDRDVYLEFEEDFKNRGYDLDTYNINKLCYAKWVVTDYSSFVFDYQSDDISTIIFAPDYESYTSLGRDVYDYFHEMSDASDINGLIKSLKDKPNKDFEKFYSSSLYACELLFEKFK